MAAKAGKPPTHTLSFLNKDTQEKGKIGVGWHNPNGSISIKLNPMVVLQQPAEVILTLFPVSEYDKKSQRQMSIPDDYYDAECNEDAPF